MENNENLNEFVSDRIRPEVPKRTARVNVTTSIKNSFWDLAKTNNIAWKDALEFGIQFLLAEKSGGLEFEYPNNYISKKIAKISENLSFKSQECEVLRDQLKAYQKAEEDQE